MELIKKFLDFFSARKTRIPTILVIGFLCGFLTSKAEVFGALSVIATPFFAVSLIGLPILIWRNSPEGRKISKKLISLIGYFLVFSVPFGIGGGVSESTPIGNERQFRSEIAAKKRAEAERAEAERAEKKRLQDLKRQKAAREKELARQQELAAAAEALKSYDLVMSVKQISNEFERNSARAEDQLKGKRIKVTGFAGNIDDGPFGENRIVFEITDGDEWAFNSVRCYMNRSDKSYQRFDKGQYLEMIGTLAGEELGVRFDDCYFP